MNNDFMQFEDSEKEKYWPQKNSQAQENDYKIQKYKRNQRSMNMKD